MLVPFTTAEAVAAAVREGLAFSAIVTVVMAVTAMWVARGSASRLGLKTVCMSSMALFACLVGVVYWSSYGRFIAADVSASEVKLRYAGPFGREVVLPREAIETVLFGLPGKTSFGGCYIRIQQTTGESHRSSTLNGQAEMCKSIRGQMLAALGKR